MFRRKEENANDPSAPFSAGASHEPAATGNAPHPQETLIPAAPASSAPTASANPQSASAQPAAAPAYSTYAPASIANASARPAAESAPRAASPTVGSYRPTPVADFNRSSIPAARTSSHEAPRATATAAPQSTSSFASTPEKSVSARPNRRVLTVGNDILLKGEIATCDRLVIEGRVEAKLSDVHTVEIAECGSFKGTAEVEDAEISGIFEGDLVVRNRLVVYATGEVRGNISYGEIEIERGGKLTGQIKTVSNTANAKNKPVDATASSRPSTVAKETVAA